MNERIRLLWAECVIKHTKDPMNWQTVADEFAELIVRECIDTVLDSSVEYATRPQIAEELKEHFGVGMSTEDKKTLIKELLGVKND